MDAELARLVIGRSRHRATVGTTAHYHRLVNQFGPIAQFHGREKHVHIDVNDLALLGICDHKGKLAWRRETVNVKI